MIHLTRFETIVNGIRSEWVHACRADAGASRSSRNVCFGEVISREMMSKIVMYVCSDIRCVTASMCSHPLFPDLSWVRFPIFVYFSRGNSSNILSVFLHPCFAIPWIGWGGLAVNEQISNSVSWNPWLISTKRKVDPDEGLIATFILRRWPNLKPMSVTCVRDVSILLGCHAKFTRSVNKVSRADVLHIFDTFTPISFL